MADPLTQVAALIQPRAPLSKITSAGGQWRVSRAEDGRPFYCTILEGTSRLVAEGHEAMMLEAGDFVLIPAARDFAMSSVPVPATAITSPHTVLPGGEVRLGDPDETPDFRALVGYCVLGSPDASLLLSLLPRIVRVRGERRLTTLVELVGEEARAQRPGRDIILARLLEVLFIEALRSAAGTAASPGLLRGLADDRVGVIIKAIHNAPERPWTIEVMAREAALSRSAFFERFQRAVGMAPMKYLSSWRMAVAKVLLLRDGEKVATVAERTGYSSSSTFSTAFKRHAGQTPAHYARSASYAQASRPAWEP